MSEGFVYIADTPQDHDNRMYEVGFSDGQEIGIRAAADALARECAKAHDEGDQERAKRFADARGCLKECFPDLNQQ